MGFIFSLRSSSVMFWYSSSSLRPSANSFGRGFEKNESGVIPSRWLNDFGPSHIASNCNSGGEKKSLVQTKIHKREVGS